MRLTAVLAATIVGMSAVTATAQSPQYTIKDLGPISPAGGTRAQSINVHGDAAGNAGNAEGEGQAAFWLAEPAVGMPGGVHGLAAQNAYGISDDRHVTGNIDTGTGGGGWAHPFVWDPINGMTMIPTIGGDFGIGRAVNNRGWVVGESDGPDDIFRRAFLWNGTETINLGAFEEGAFSSRAKDINEAGHVVGFSQYLGPPEDPDNGMLRSALWLLEPAYGLPAGLHDLDDISVETWQISSAQGVNDLGHVVSWGSNIINHHQYYTAFWLWLPEPAYGLPAGMNDLGGPFGLESTAFVHDINNRGEVVFRANIDPESLLGDWRAVVWRQGEWFDLIEAIPAEDQLEWWFGSATDINDAGQIVGWGWKNGEARGFLLTPVVDSGCPEDVDASGDIGFNDILEIISAWGCTACPSRDVDGNGVVEAADLLLTLSAFGPCSVNEVAACCFGKTGDCQELTMSDCLFLGGTYQDGTTCETFDCVQPYPGACCLYPSGSCEQINEYLCELAGGTWSGPFSPCGEGACPQAPEGDTLENAIVIDSLPYSTDGATDDFGDWYDEVCDWTSAAPEVVYTYTPFTDLVVNISLCEGSEYDTKLYVYEGDETNTVACNDDACDTPGMPDPFVSRIDAFTMEAGRTYYIVIDGWGSWAGYYTLDVEIISAGACCLPSGDCLDQSEDVCLSQADAVWFGGEACDSFACPALPTGACCLPSGSCVSNQTEWDCENLFDGTWAGEGVSCFSANCP
jgi:probable HAF family extracellular repeat protein